MAPITQLPQNFAFDGQLDFALMREFMGFMEKKHVDPRSDFAVQRAWGQFSNQVMGGGDASAQYLRNNLFTGPYSSTNKIYPSGPFSWQVNDFLSDVVPDGNVLSQWIETNGNLTTEYETVAHLGWVAPSGWTGTNYKSFLANLEIGECEFGPSTKYAAYSYRINYGTFSRSTDTFKVIPTLVVNREYRESPTYRLRGPNTGLPLDNDEDFQVARMGMDARNHLAWNLIYGEKANSDQEWDGLDVVLSSGYVQARSIPGNTNVYGYDNPYIVDGSVLATPQAVLQEIRYMIRHIRSQAAKRKWSIMDGDQAIVMCLAHWQALAEYLSINGLVEGQTYVDVASAEERLNRMMSTPALMVDGRAVPVLIEDDLGENTNSNTTATGDIYILVKRAGGITLLEQQMINFSAAQARFNQPANMSMNVGLGGLARYGVVVENGTCWYAFVEMGGRLVSRYQPFQGRINSVTLPLHGVYRVESGSYTEAFYGNQSSVPGTLGVGI